MPQTIFRIAKNREHPYTVVANALVQDASLSFEARGLMVYLLSKPDNWEMRMSDLMAASPRCKAAATQRIVKELLDAGYLERNKERDAQGHIVYVTLVHEDTVGRFPAHGEPVDGLPVDESPVDESPVDESPVDESPVDGKAPHLLSTDSPITDSPNTEKIDGAVAPARPAAKAPRARKPAAVSDPRSQHPAILGVKRLLGRWPNKALWGDIIGVLGDEFDPSRLEVAYKAWVAKGYNPYATTWMDWYVSGIPTNGARASPPVEHKPVRYRNPYTGLIEETDG